MLARLHRLAFLEQSLCLAAAASALLLAGALVFEHGFGYAPCPLCLDQRGAHWAALFIAVAGLSAHFVARARLAAAAAAGALALVYAVSAGMAFFHTGVEFGYWPGPASCAGGGAVLDAGSLGAALGERPKGPSCSEAAWRFLGVSMAGYNLVASAGLFALTVAAALFAARAERERRRADSARNGSAA